MKYLLKGIGIDAFDPKQKLYPLASGVDVADISASKDEARYIYI